MQLSVIIPAWNEEPRIAAAVASARAWSDPPTEVIVVDAGSDDGTAAAALRAGADRVLTSDRGRAVQMNRGAGAACGNALLFLHSDCRLPVGGGSQVVAALQDERVVGGCFRQRIDAAGLRFRLVERGNTMRARIGKSIYGDQAMFVRRTVFQSLGGYPVVPLLEDWMFSRALRRRGRLVVLPGPLAVSARRWRQSGLVRQTLQNWSILWRARRGISLDQLAAEYRPIR